MKHLKMFAFAAMAAAALMALVGVGSASAETELFSGNTTLGTDQTISSSLESGTTARLQSTSEALTDTCTESSVSGTTTSVKATEATIGGKITTLSFGNCAFTTHPDELGFFSVETIGSGPDGTLRGSHTTVTITISGATCIYGTGTGTHLGTVTGFTGKNATIDINAVLNEQPPLKILCPDTTRWTA